MITVHGSCVSLSGAGVLVRGASGAGKSRFVQLVLDTAARQQRYACLVADDRVRLGSQGGRVVARPHPELLGLLEVRGLGIVRLPHEDAAVVRLLVDIVAATDMLRMPDQVDGAAYVLGVEVPRILVTDAAHAVVTVFQLLAISSSALRLRLNPQIMSAT